MQAGLVNPNFTLKWFFRPSETPVYAPCTVSFLGVHERAVGTMRIFFFSLSESGISTETRD